MGFILIFLWLVSYSFLFYKGAPIGARFVLTSVCQVALFMIVFSVASIFKLDALMSASFLFNMFVWGGVILNFLILGVVWLARK